MVYILLPPLIFPPQQSPMRWVENRVIDPNLSSQLPCLRQNQSFYFPIQHLSQYPKGGDQKSQDGSHNHTMKALQHTLESGRNLNSELWPPFSSLVVFCINLVKRTRQRMKKRERDIHKISFILELRLKLLPHLDFFDLLPMNNPYLKLMSEVCRLF